MHRKITVALLFGCIGGWVGRADAATVVLSADATAVAEGGTITFTVDVTPSTYVQKVVLTYSGLAGGDEDTTAPYIIPHTFSACADYTVTATVSYTNGDPDDTDNMSVSVVGLSISGSTSVLRGFSGVWLAQSNPVGKTIDQFDWSYSWASLPGGEQAGTNTYQDLDLNYDEKSYWGGRMAVPGTLSCSATVLGVSVQKSLPIAINPRNWPVPIIACATDNEAGWGDVPTVEAGFEGVFGQNRDRDSDDSSAVFVPRNGDSFAPARTLGLISGGPCDGWYFVQSSTLKCQRETVINRYIKSGGPLPSGASENFYDHNDNSCFVPGYYDSEDFVNAVRQHEFQGPQWPETEDPLAGHQGRITYRIQSLLPPQWDLADPKQKIEPLVARNLSALSVKVDDEIIAAEDEVIGFAGSDDYMLNVGKNWGNWPNFSLGIGQHSRWDENGAAWSDCTNGPGSF